MYDVLLMYKRIEMQFNEQHQLIISSDYIFIFSQSKAAADA